MNSDPFTPDAVDIVECHPAGATWSAQKKLHGGKALVMSKLAKLPALVIFILLFTAGTAMAAVITGGNDNNTLVGTPLNDVITDGAGNNAVWGLAGSDLIVDGSGNDVIDGDGRCSQGTASDYCSHGPIPDDGGDFIVAGNGNDTVFGGGGDNTIWLGNGNDTVYGGPKNDQIAAGVGSLANDRVYVGSGANIVAVGDGNNVVFAFHNGDTRVDRIFCGNRSSVVYANPQDVVTGCSVVVGAPKGRRQRRRG